MTKSQNNSPKHSAVTAPKKQSARNINRRSFIKNATATAVVAGSVASTLAGARAVHADEDTDVLRVGLVGCGGRGTGAAQNAMKAHPKNKLVALCDIFPDRIDQCKKGLKKTIGEQYAVAEDHCFSGFDGCNQLIASGVDVVLLCTPTYFRPVQLRACIEANKHVFCEKPVAVDGPGLRSILKSTEMAREKGLNLVSGLCWRYDKRVIATMDRILDGAIGDIVATQENYFTNTLWHRGHKDHWSEMEYQIRNWIYFNWLSGDMITEQHIHSLDKSLWLHGDKPPVKCVANGGRQSRTEEEWGNVFDHFSTIYEWENGTKTFSYCRQQANSFTDTEDYIFGTKGNAEVLDFTIRPNDGPAWKYEGESPGMYDWEHVKLFEAIRSGNAINNGEYMTYSTLMALMGREAAYTGGEVTADEIMKSEVKLGPETLGWTDVETAPVPKPGVTKLFGV